MTKFFLLYVFLVLKRWEDMQISCGVFWIFNGLKGNFLHHIHYFDVLSIYWPLFSSVNHVDSSGKGSFCLGELWDFWVWLVAKRSTELITFACHRNESTPFCCVKDGKVIHKVHEILNTYICFYFFCNNYNINNCGLKKSPQSSLHTISRFWRKFLLPKSIDKSS